MNDIEKLIDWCKSVTEPTWGATDPKTDLEHIADYAKTLQLTREGFANTEPKMRMHSVSLGSTEEGPVLCFTGNSPNSGLHAQMLTGLMRAARAGFLTSMNPGADATIAEYKNFHLSLCARFGYMHDPVDWRRDLVSLEEHIAEKIAVKDQTERAGG